MSYGVYECDDLHTATVEAYNLPDINIYIYNLYIYMYFYLGS